jgi:hypothetical protein
MDGHVYDTRDIADAVRASYKDDEREYDPLILRAVTKLGRAPGSPRGWLDVHFQSGNDRDRWNGRGQ